MAWLMAALVPVMFVVGLLAAYAIEGVVAPDTEGNQRSLVSDLLGAIVTSVLVLLPAVGAWRRGSHAESLGYTSAPRLLAAALAAVAEVVVVAQVVLNASAGRY